MKNKKRVVIFTGIVLIVFALIFGFVKFGKNEFGYEDCLKNNGYILNGEQCSINGKVFIQDGESINLEKCVSYFDGCNNCIVVDGEIKGCDKRFCTDEIIEEPKCVENN